MIDPFHLDAYGKTTVNYNRDIEIFPVVRAMFELIVGKSPYQSPTDMGVNMAGNCIMDDDACRRASEQEIIRRYYKCLCDKKRNGTTKDNLNKLELLMNQAGVSVQDRAVRNAALDKEEQTDGPSAAIELPDGTIVTGKTSALLGPMAGALLNALKYLTGIDKETDLVSPQAIKPIQDLKTVYLGSKNPRLHTDEVLIALSASAEDNVLARQAMEKLPELRGCDAHCTVLLSSVDEQICSRLGMYLTCEPKYEEASRLYHKN